MTRRGCGSIAITILLLCLFVAGCKQKQADSAEKWIKDELVLAIGGEPEAGFDPTTGWGRYGSPLFQSTLFKRDHEMKIINDLALQYDVSDDGKVWTVRIRDDVKFSDGVRLTAEDVRFTYETALQKGSVVDLTNIEKVETLNAHTVRFTLKEAQSTFIDTLTTTGIVAKHAYGQKYGEHPVGSGPYQLVQWDKGQQLIVKANPEYYGKKPYFQKLTFLFLNEDASLAAAKTGEVDVAAVPAAFSRQKVSGMKLEVIESVDNRGIVFPYVKSGAKTKEGYPIGHDVTADHAIRYAINLAIDREALIEGILEGYGTPAYSPVDKLPWWNEATVFSDGDREGAKKVLKDGGWNDADGDGVLEKDGLKAEFTLYYPANDVVRQSLALAVRDMIRPLGIKIKVEGASWDEIKQKMHANAVLMGWGSHHPNELYYIYSSHNAGVDYYNPGFYENKTVDEYFSKALQATKESEAQKYWQLAQWDGTTGLSTLGDAPWAWLVNLDHLYFVKDGLDIGKQQVHPHGHGFPITANLEEWKWKKE